jgi:hypothetical protein
MGFGIVYSKSVKTKNSRIPFIILLFTAITTNTNAQENTVSRNWGIETEIIAPFYPTVNIITFKSTKTIFGELDAEHGDGLLGIYVRPFIKHDVVERIEEYMISIGYRHYFMESFHVEAQYYAGYVYGEKNKIDGKNYQSFVHFVEATLGYRFDFFRQMNTGIYIIPQFGYLQGLNDELVIGPRGGKGDGFIVGKLLVGISF